jgi:2-polyprenyl-6-methoxyphenol hydroxylase-like FAD-dependent oxidoreductase
LSGEHDHVAASISGFQSKSTIAHCGSNPVRSAIHTMTPTLGRDANVAMRDGALLGRHIIAVEQGKVGLSEALNAYESEMTALRFRRRAGVGNHGPMAYRAGCSARMTYGANVRRRRMRCLF